MAKSNATYVEPGVKIVSVRFVLALLLVVAGIAWILFYYLSVRPDPTVFPAPKGSPKADLARQFISFCSNAQVQAVAAAKTGWGPSNPNAIKSIDAERAKILPTYPENFKNQAQIDFKFWGAVQEDATKRFNDWLLIK